MERAMLQAPVGLSRRFVVTVDLEDMAEVAPAAVWTAKLHGHRDIERVGVRRSYRTQTRVDMY